MYVMFNREQVQCWQNWANMVIHPGSSKNSYLLHFGSAGVCFLHLLFIKRAGQPPTNLSTDMVW